jgi:hypothetical protein
MTPVAAAKKRREFTLKTFLSTIDGGRTIATSTKRQRVFVQGDVADAVFYIQKGKVKLTVVSTSGKEATIGILNEGAFFGEGCLTGRPFRMCSASTITDCTVMRIDKKSMMEVITENAPFPTCSWHFCSPATSDTRKTWLTTCSTPARSDWLVFSSC